MTLKGFLKKFLPARRGSHRAASGSAAGRVAGAAADEEAQVQADKLEGFDWKFYLNFYPDLRRSGINNKKRATRHWLQRGCAEGRIGGRQHRTFQNNLQLLKDYLASVEPRAAQARIALANQPAPLINVLTRSNKRPRFFHDNRSSVVAQTYKNFRQIISYENGETREYLRQAGISESDLLRVVRQQTQSTHPYNLFVNDLMDQVADGWILFLDDDDLFTTPEALTMIASRLSDENKLVVWRAWFPDKVVPFTRDIRIIEPGGIASCCFAFHSKHKDKARWHEHRAADYRCFDQLRNQLEAVFLEDILTRVNYFEVEGKGWGEAKDKKK